MKNLLVLLLCCFATHSIIAQVILPKGFAPGERERMPEYLENASSRDTDCQDIPDNAQFRSMAEWEELEALVITWTDFPIILTEIVKASQQEVKVFIVTENSNSVSNYLTQAGVDINLNIEFVNSDFNTIWVRDYGPNAVYQDKVGERAIVDWIYNRPRPDDDVVPAAIAELLNVPLYCTSQFPEDLVHTGGNFMSDGMGNAFSSQLVLHENDMSNEFGISNHSEAEVDAIMNKYMGISTYPKMTNLPYDGIHHIDMHMKLLDEETLLVGEYPAGVADGPQIEANIQYVLDNFPAPSGLPHKVIRIPMPPDANGDFPDYPGGSWWLGGDYRTYANAVFVNKTILVPTYEEQYDTTALRIWEETMPGFNIVGVNAEAMISLSGAIHCITKEIGVAEPLLVNHLTPREFCTEDDSYRLEAIAAHVSGIASLDLNYRVSGAIDYTTVAMNYDPSGDFYFIDLADDFLANESVEYYFAATANSGKVINRPLPAPVAYFTIPVKACSPSNTANLEAINTAKLYPNPASAITCLELELATSIDGSVTLTNIFGQRLKTIHQGLMPKGAQKYFLNAEELTSGVYFLEVSGAAQRVFTTKLVVE